MTSTANSVIAATITAGVITGAMMYLFPARESSATRPDPVLQTSTTQVRQNVQPPEHHLFIFVDLDENNKCRSITFPPKASVVEGSNLHWRIIATKEGKRNCLKNKRKVMLKPKAGHTSTLTPKEPENKPDDEGNLRATAGYPAGSTGSGPYKYSYEVWLAGDTKPVEDPELEIIELR